MTSVVSESARNLRPLFNKVKSSKGEKKFSRCDKNERIKVVEGLSDTELFIVYLAVNKKNNSRKKSFGSKLYRETLIRLIERSLDELKHNDVHIIIDSSYHIKRTEFETLCQGLCHKHGKQLKKCYKGISQNDPCIRIADFASGTIWCHCEHNDNTYYSILEKRLIDARK